MASLSRTTVVIVENCRGVVPFFFLGEVFLSYFRGVPVVYFASKDVVFLRLCCHQSFLDLINVYNEFFLRFLVVDLRNGFGFAKISLQLHVEIGSLTLPFLIFKTTHYQATC